jgi:hypothetical protein
LTHTKLENEVVNKNDKVWGHNQSSIQLVAMFTCVSA